LERCLYKLCERTGEGGRQGGRAAETQVGGQLQKFCVRYYRNNEIYSNTTIDIPECPYVCPVLHVIPTTVHTLLQSTYNGMERNRARDENR
jgi:hypothetical protein